MKISFIIINFNSNEYTLQCINQINNSNHDLIDYEIIVIDNGSSTNQLSTALSANSLVKFITLERSVGFAEANNIAFKLASGSYLFMINNDIELNLNTVKSITHFFNITPQAAIVTPKILNADLTLQHLNYTYDYSFFTELLKLLGFYKICNFFKVSKFPLYGVNPSKSVQEVKHVCGCFLAIRRECLIAVNYLDNSFVFGFEDADLCKRVSKEFPFYKIYSLNFCSIVHFGGGSRKFFNPAVHRMMTDSFRRYFLKHYGLISFLIIYVIRWLNSLFHLFVNYIIYYIFKGKISDYNNKYHLSIIFLKS